MARLATWLQISVLEMKKERKKERRARGMTCRKKKEMKESEKRMSKERKDENGGS